MFAVTTNSFVGVHKDHHRYPDLIDDPLPERNLGNVWNILSRRVTQNKGAMTLRCFWNCQRVDKRKLKKFRRDLKVVQRVPEGVSELRELNNVN
jgi:fatty-acid desaturase